MKTAKVHLLLLSVLIISIVQAENQYANQSEPFVANDISPAMTDENRLVRNLDSQWSEPGVETLLKPNIGQYTLKSGAYGTIPLQVRAPQRTTPISTLSDYEDVSPIYIDDNADFGPSGYDFPGAGTSSSPYVIDGYNITDSSAHLLHIANTTAYFRISNNLLDGTNRFGSYNGILLSNVTHGIVGNNVIRSCYRGIYLDTFSHDNEIADNEVFDTQRGIQLLYTWGNTMHHNTLRDNYYGMLLGSSNYSVVNHNTIFNSIFDGLYLNDAYITSIVHNTIYDNGQNGIHLYGAGYNAISHNTISDNSEFGIWFRSNSDYNDVSNNTIAANYNYSIWIWYAFNNKITWNIFRWNNWGGNAVQAFDASTSHNNAFSHNYWDDWTSPDSNSDGIVDNPYTIDAQTGFANNKDYFPRVSPYVARAPIYIDENSDFAKLGFPGDGSQANPYLIIGYNITNPRSSLIHIQDTTAYFVVGNNELNGLTESYNGIYLLNVTHGTITSNAIHHGLNGIQLESCYGEPLLDQAQEGTNYGYWFEQGVIRWQEFVPSHSLLTQIDLYIDRRGDPGGNMRVAVKDGTRNQVWETTVQKGTIPIGRGWVEVPLASALSVVPGNSYYIYVWGDAASPGPTNRYFWTGQSSSNYDAGISSVEAALPGYDFSFRTYGMDVSNIVSDNWVHDNGVNGIFLDSSHCTVVSNNTVYHNDANGIFLLDSESNSIFDNTVYDNGDSNGGLMLLSQGPPTALAAGSFGHGIYLDPSHYNLIDNNDVYNNLANGIFLNASDSTAVSDNEVYQNGANGVFLLDSESNSITENTIHDNGNSNGGLVALSRRLSIPLAAGSFGHGIFLDPSHYNLIDNNTVYNNLANGVHLENSGYNTISDNTISGNGNSNGGLMLLSQGSLRTLAAGSFGHGIYLDPSDYNLIKNNDVYDNYVNGIFLNDSDNTAVSDNEVYQNGANGVFLLDSESNSITENTIHDNGDSNGGLVALSRRLAIPLAAGSFGHGIFLDPSHYNLIDNNTVYNNLANGVHLENSGHNTITNNTISDNGDSTGGLVLLSQDSPTTLAAGSFGHGIYLDPSDYNLIEDNVVCNNLANGVFLNASDNTAVSDNEVYQNGANGVFLLDSESNSITENTIHDNGDSNGGLVALSRRSSIPLAAGSFGHGIFLDPSHNNLIDNNIVYNNLANGVHLENSDHNTISNNTISGHGNSNGGLMVLSQRTPTTLAAGSFGHGIYLDPSDYNLIDNNTVYNNFVNGIFLNDSDNTAVSDNDVYENGANGVFLLDSGFNSITENTIHDNGNSDGGLATLSRRTPATLAAGSFGHGIFLDPSHYNLIDNNTVYNNLVNGVHLENSDHNTISNNTISGHGNSNGGLMALSRRTPTTLAAGSFGHGIYLDPSNNNTIVNNVVRDNAGNGVFLNASDSTIVSGNTIVGNTLYGINVTADSDDNSVAFNNFLENNPEGSSQARDDGFGNLFASNYWDDWTGFGAYPIDGDADNQDESPLEEPIAPSEHLLLEPTVLYPNGREKLSGTVTIQWQPSVDSLGHDIVYTVSYSEKWVKSCCDHHSYHRRKDCKVFDHRRRPHSNRWERDWIILAEGIETLSFEWDTTTVPNGNNYMIKVEAFCSEGLTADDTSDRAFKIKNRHKSSKRHHLFGDAADLVNLPDEVTSSGIPSWSLLILGLSLIGAMPIRQLRRTWKD